MTKSSGTTPQRNKPPHSNKASQALQRKNVFFSGNWLLAAILIVIATCLYANTCNNGYVLDDVAVIQQNTIVAEGISALPKIFATPYHQGFYRDQSHDTSAFNDLYRPLSIAMFAIERQVSDNSPAFCHAINVLLYDLCVVLLFFFFLALFGMHNKWLSFTAALLFAIHPVHTDVVANIKSQDELLCFLFSLLSLLSFTRYAQNKRAIWLASGIVCYFTSLLAKETSIVLLVLIPFIFFFVLHADRRKSVVISLSSIAAALCYLAIRTVVLKTYHANSTAHIYFLDNELTNAPSLMSRFATALYMLGYYLRLLVVPYPLSCDYSFATIPFVTFGNPWVWLTILAYGSLKVIAILRFIKNKKDPYVFGIVFFLVSIALFSNIFFHIGANMAERFLFFPSAGFLLLPALLLTKWAGKSTGADAFPKKILWAILPLCVIFGYITIARNADWKSNYSLFSKDLEHFPRNARLLHGVGGEYTSTFVMAESDTNVQKILLQQGINYINKSIAVYPGDFKAFDDLGNTYARINKMDSAAWAMQQSIRLAPTIAVPVSDLGAIYYKEGNYPLAISYSKMALQLNPNYVGIMVNLSICYYQAKYFDSSRMLAQKALTDEPDNKLAQDMQAACNRELKRISDSTLNIHDTIPN